VIAFETSEVLLDDTPREVFSQTKTLAKTDVNPPVVTQIDNRLGLSRTVLLIDDLSNYVG
jgi:hypothetical protein